MVKHLITKYLSIFGSISASLMLCFWFPDFADNMNLLKFTSTDKSKIMHRHKFIKATGTVALGLSVLNLAGAGLLMPL